MTSRRSFSLTAALLLLYIICFATIPTVLSKKMLDQVTDCAEPVFALVLSIEDKRKKYGKRARGRSFLPEHVQAMPLNEQEQPSLQVGHFVLLVKIGSYYRRYLPVTSLHARLRLAVLHPLLFSTLTVLPIENTRKYSGITPYILQPAPKKLLPKIGKTDLQLPAKKG